MNQYRISRRRAVVACASTLAGGVVPGQAQALADIVLVLLPALLPGLIALLGIDRQEAGAQRRHDQQLALELRRLDHEQRMLEVQQRADQRRFELELANSRRDGALALLQLLATSGQRYGESVFDRAVLSMLVDDITGRPVGSALLSENADHQGTRVGIVQGHVAVERTSHGAYLTPGAMQYFAASDRLRSGVIPVPTTGLRRDLSSQLRDTYSEHFARELGLPNRQAVEEAYFVVGDRLYSSAKRPKGRADLVEVAFHPKAASRRAASVALFAAAGT